MTTHQFINLAASVGIVWLLCAVAVTYYADTRGYPWFAIFISALFLGFPVVLFVLAVLPERKAVR